MESINELLLIWDLQFQKEKVWNKKFVFRNF